ncbi:MAG: large subunit of alpha-aminoadipate reductase [Icmadophila ericetorum]|nr:large subunit of alpha-aminoadipate reductase [Icmadophila ericetorum]
MSNMDQAFNDVSSDNEDIRQMTETLRMTADENPYQDEGNILPDPTTDLHWSDYRGAIHEIFARNAEEFPERACVIETASESTPRKEFNYGQIHAASNILAHHLISKGVERGDVVMVYAYRGVDLVVAVMGVLKAGATFSVIDPLYPPERQKIYLEVAKPRALINIAKATLEAGELSRVVRSYIIEELELRTEVPALRLRDDGVIEGGQVNGADVLDTSRGFARKIPHVGVGPDSNPTLSFTSGSEGRPKGVLGRHFSLAYYFPWMAKRFGLTKDERFTMLSGIAHDPIQRDIFTPLFLGAQLLVPSKEDIQHEHLAQWMYRYKATVTHLTPAMGQILVGGASRKFYHLHHAFFVGDLLTRRDCRILQSLCKNVNIINMYGTTETQRAVSYFEIPSRVRNERFLEDLGKDIIPAGKGMMDVQLLVVNREDKNKQCKVGEVGEIYVRAGGLAEGYLGDKEMNAKKFLENWFVDSEIWRRKDLKEAASSSPRPEWRGFYRGPRDRLYRTGDLGRYLPSGDVECTGRADDQVKIRGFRIELGEINSHLSTHQLIRDCVTLVRRNKDEEAILVSYIVPEMNKWPTWLQEKGLQDSTQDETMVGMLRRFWPLSDVLRTHLKGYLASHAIPTHFIPLKKLPLNPNGKVDKPTLPFPDVADFIAAEPEERSKAWNSLSDTERIVATIWGELIPGCSAKSIRPDDSFFDLGGHSLLAQQMLLMLKRKLDGYQPAMALLFRDPTLKGFAASIDQSRVLNGDSTVAHGLTNGHVNGIKHDGEDYAEDARKLARELPPKFLSCDYLDWNKPLTVFLTGATGFLGAFLIRELLSRHSPSLKVIAHTRANSVKLGMERIELTCNAYGFSTNKWKDRLSCVIGDLSLHKLGLDDNTWSNLAEEVDAMIHNGAQVHWVYPYSKLKPSNVHGTIEMLRLCSVGKSKRFSFISSTSVLDNEHYIRISKKSLEEGGKGVSEIDDLEGSSTGLSTGYGQSKWVSEHLVREAGRRGLRGTIVRPGYILGDSESGVTNTDDFLVRLLKGCIQLSSRPLITNTINMVPVDYVAQVITASTLTPHLSTLLVAQTTSHPRLRFYEYLSLLETYGYVVPEAPYREWCHAFENYVEKGGKYGADGGEQHALMPLYHFIAGDLPSNTIAPELDDTNTSIFVTKDNSLLKKPGMKNESVDKELVGKYIRYLIDIGFLVAPVDGRGMVLPQSRLAEGQREALGRLVGRGGDGQKGFDVRNR